MIRAKLLERAVAPARAVNYDNLGTVEFILEEAHDDPWFLEMNTRLQVEHAATEAITGFDLVEWQIRIASGEHLPALQDAVTENGHAIEARITAERADQGFRPDGGCILGYSEPASVRVDSGVAAGSDVTLFYDSLLAKANGAGEPREIARAKLVAGLEDFTIFGPATTLPFLIDALESPVFAEGRATTRFIEDTSPEGWKPGRPHARLARAAAALLSLAEPASGAATASAWTRLSGFRLLGPAGGVSETRLVASENGETSRLAVRIRADRMRRVFDERGEVLVDVRSHAPALEIEADGHVLRGAFEAEAGRVRLTLGGAPYDVRVEPEVAMVAASSAAAGGSGAVIAPMPGVGAEVNVAVGDRVEVGQVVAVLESMKLFTSLCAESADVNCRAGETAPVGKRLVLIEPQAAA